MVALPQAVGPYDGFLPTYYHQFGFEEDQRIKFSPDYPPESWDFAKYNQPRHCIHVMAWLPKAVRLVR